MMNIFVNGIIASFNFFLAQHNLYRREASHDFKLQSFLFAIRWGWFGPTFMFQL